MSPACSNESKQFLLCKYLGVCRFPLLMMITRMAVQVLSLSPSGVPGFTVQGIPLTRVTMKDYLPADR